MLTKVLPDYLNSILNKELEFAKVYELRLRVNAPIVINYAGQYTYLSRYGITGLVKTALVCDKKLLDSIILRACDHSIYAVNSQLKNAFVTIAGGVRIGVCGETVIESGQVKTIKNFSSITIRIPHAVNGCAMKAYELLTTPEIFSTLVISPPGGGKTTFLRDFSRLLCGEKRVLNILIIDERSEIAAFQNGIPQFDTGITTDVLTNCTKEYGFMQGIRALRPDIIIADELMGREDIDSILHAASCGIKVIASIHANGIEDLKGKPAFKDVLTSKVFDRFVVLSERNGAGTFEGVFDSELKNIYFPKV